MCRERVALVLRRAAVGKPALRGLVHTGRRVGVEPVFDHAVEASVDLAELRGQRVVEVVLRLLRLACGFGRRCGRIAGRLFCRVDLLLLPRPLREVAQAGAAGPDRHGRLHVQALARLARALLESDERRVGVVRIAVAEEHVAVAVG